MLEKEACPTWYYCKAPTTMGVNMGMLHGHDLIPEGWLLAAWHREDSQKKPKHPCPPHSTHSPLGVVER